MLGVQASLGVRLTILMLALTLALQSSDAYCYSRIIWQQL